MKPAALWRDPLGWLAAALLLAVLGMGQLKPLFAALYPELERPMYEQDSFLALLLAHVALVLLASAIAALLGVGLGLLVTRTWGLAFRPRVESVVAVGRTFPPVARTKTETRRLDIPRGTKFAIFADTNWLTRLISVSTTNSQNGCAVRPFFAARILVLAISTLKIVPI